MHLNNENIPNDDKNDDNKEIPKEFNSADIERILKQSYEEISADSFPEDENENRQNNNK